MKNLLTLGLLLSGLLASAQSFEWNDDTSVKGHPKEVMPDDTAYERAYNERQNGKAGIYAPADNGLQTAYGEVYRADEMTGSHAILPLGTLLRVTNVSNGRVVTVRVTDRGRECEGCLVTLSEAAAEQLGLNDKGAVSLERSGFSNWNPLPPEEGQPVLAAYGTPAVIRKPTPAPSGGSSSPEQNKEQSSGPSPSQCNGP